MARCACRAGPASNRKARGPRRLRTECRESAGKIHHSSWQRQFLRERRNGRRNIWSLNGELNRRRDRMAVAAPAPMCCRKQKSQRRRARFQRERRDRRFSATDWKGFRPKTVLYLGAGLFSRRRDRSCPQSLPGVPSAQRFRGSTVTCRNTHQRAPGRDRPATAPAKSTWSRRFRRRRTRPLRPLRALQCRAPASDDSDYRCAHT